TPPGSCSTSPVRPSGARFTSASSRSTSGSPAARPPTPRGSPSSSPPDARFSRGRGAGNRQCPCAPSSLPYASGSPEPARRPRDPLVEIQEPAPRLLVVSPRPGGEAVASRHRIVERLISARQLGQLAGREQLVDPGQPDA